MEPVDVMVNTYNSEWKLDECLSSIERSIPVRKLWVIDKFSEDRTIEIAKKHNASIIQSDVSLASARALGFRMVWTPIFVNIDSDIVLPDNWFRDMMKYWDDDKIGCLWSIPLHTHPLHRTYQLTMAKWKNPCSYHIPRLPNMIARKNLLENIQFPESLKYGSTAGEDYYIMQWIEKQGFKCKSVPIYTDHYTFPSLLDTKTFWGGASVRISHRRQLRFLLKQVSLALPQGMFVSVMSRNPRIIPYWFKFRMQELYGWLHWNKYWNLKR